MELVYDTATTGNQYVGMRFANLGIPQGATITNAYIQFTVNEKNSGGLEHCQLSRRRSAHA